MDKLIGIFAAHDESELIDPVDPYGQELIINGNFETDDSWICDAQWSIIHPANYASYNHSLTGTMYEILTGNLVIGKKYKLEYSISGGSGSAWMAFFKYNEAYVFFEWQCVKAIPNGNYIEEVTCISNSNNIQVYGNQGGKSFNIDNISLKEKK